MGSVKDLIVKKNPTKTEMGIGQFIFSDRYSVFDWGEMPDHIPDKGKSIAILSAHFFEKLEQMGMKTHFIGIVDTDNKPSKINELSSPSNIMEIKLLRVLKPEYKNSKYEYSIYKNEKGNFLIPLEIIYRNSLPAGSSIFKRLKDGKIKPEDLGLSKYPKSGEKLDTPILDVSTKLEATDRYITWEEASRIACLSANEIQNIKKIAIEINSLISKEFEKIGFINEDGKIEVGFDIDRQLILVDVLGTLDECRFTYKGIPMSKEIARIYYRKTPWYETINDAKTKYGRDWKKYCKINPEPLPEELKNSIADIYRYCTNTITGKEWFKLTNSFDKNLAIIEKYCS